MNPRARRLMVPLSGAIVAAGVLGAGLLGGASAAAGSAATQQAAAPAKFTSDYTPTVAEIKGAKSRAQAVQAKAKAKAKAKAGVSSIKAKQGTGTLKAKGPSGAVAPGKPTETLPGAKAAASSNEATTPKTTGKVVTWWSEAPGQYFECSGNVVMSKHKNLVSTAAWCLWDQEWRLADGAIFIPYFDGTKPNPAPYGLWQGEIPFIPGAFKQGNLDFDYAFFTVSKNKGKRLAGVVGGQGFTWGREVNERFRVFGYSGVLIPPGDGNIIRWCNGTGFHFQTTPPPSLVQEHVGIKCRLSYGMEGGPWFKGWSNQDRWGYQNGVTSLVWDDDGNDTIEYLTTVYFDYHVYSVYKQAAKNASLYDLP